MAALMTQPHDGHGPKDTCPGCPHGLTITGSTVKVRCTCGEEIEFEDVHDEWQHIYPCEGCGKRISLQIDPLLQFDQPSDAGATQKGER